MPLVRLRRRTFTADETLAAAVEVAHFGPNDLRQVRPEWTIKDQQGHTIASGKLPVCDLPKSKLSPLGKIPGNAGQCPLALQTEP